MDKPDSSGLLEQFIVREMADELLVYDLRNQKISSLNSFAAKVWYAWHEHRDTLGVAAALSASGTASADLRSIENALDMLADANLVERPSGRRTKTGSSRRDFFRRAAGAAATVAVVVSVTAPTPAAAASSGCSGGCAPPTPYCNWEEECVQCLNYEHCVEINKSFCSNFECF